MLVVAFGIVNHVAQQILGRLLVAVRVQQPGETLAAITRAAEAIETFSQILVALLLKELPDLTRSAGREVSGVFARPRRPLQNRRSRRLVDVGRADLDAVQHLAVVKAC